MSNTKQVRQLKGQITTLRLQLRRYKTALLECYRSRQELEVDFLTMAELHNDEVLKNLRYEALYGRIDDPSNWIAPRLSAGDDNPGPGDWYNAGMDCTQDETSSARALSGHLFGDPS